MRLPFLVPISLHGVDFWFQSNRPTQIEMSDAQYHHFAILMRANVTHYNNIPIVFVDAPQPTV